MTNSEIKKEIEQLEERKKMLQIKSHIQREGRICKATNLTV